MFSDTWYAHFPNSAYASLIISALPIILHLFDRALELIPILGEQALRAKMTSDGREFIADVGRTENKFLPIKAYFDFEHGVHFIVSIVIFCAISMVFAQVEVTGSLSCVRPEVLVIILLLGVFLFSFLQRLISGKLDPARVHVLRKWTIASVLCFISVLVVQIYMHFAHH